MRNTIGWRHLRSGVGGRYGNHCDERLLGRKRRSGWPAAAFLLHSQTDGFRHADRTPSTQANHRVNLPLVRKCRRLSPLATSHVTRNEFSSAPHPSSHHILI